MATVTGYTAQRMKQIEDKAIVDGEVQVDNLILIARDGTNIDAGSVRGPKGDRGPTGEVSDAELAAVTGVSGQVGNDLTLGTDSKVFFDHDNKYKDHVPKFADTAARSAAIPAPVNGQMCVTAGVVYQYDSITSNWMQMMSTAMLFDAKSSAPYQLTIEAGWELVPLGNVAITDPLGRFNAPGRYYTLPARAGYVEIFARATLVTSGGYASNAIADVYLGSSASFRICQINGTSAGVAGSSSAMIKVNGGEQVSIRAYMAAPSIVKNVFEAALQIRYAT